MVNGAYRHGYLLAPVLAKAVAEFLETGARRDGVFVDGPEGFAYPALWECKCLGRKSWSDLQKKGLAVSKPVYAAQVAGYTFGVINSYLWNSNWTFREQRTRSLKEMGLFLLVNIASLGVSLGMMWLLREVFGVTNEWVAQWMPAALAGFIKGDTIAKLIATVFAIAVNFLGNRLFVFKRTPAATEQAPELPQA